MSKYMILEKLQLNFSNIDYIYINIPSNWAKSI